MSPADVLLLDEPTNHLDLETTTWLEEYLATVSATVLLISHDRAFLAAVVDHVLHFEGDSATAYAGSYAVVRRTADAAAAHAAAAFDQQQRKIASEQDYIARNLAGQNTKQAKGRRKRLERTAAPQRADRRRRHDGGALRGRASAAAIASSSPSMRRSAWRIACWSSDLNATLMRGDTLGLIGSERLRQVDADPRAAWASIRSSSGELRVGGGITVGYYRQDMAQVPLDQTLYDVINDLRPTWDRRMVQGHLGRFGFSGDEVQRRADTLSGGERARVALAMLMLSRREPADSRRADEPPRRRVDRSARRRDRAVRRHACCS